LKSKAPQIFPFTASRNSVGQSISCKKHVGFSTIFVEKFNKQGILVIAVIKEN